MNYILCTSLEQYQQLNHAVTVGRNYELHSVQVETGTTMYAPEQPEPIYYDAEKTVYTEQNAEQTLSEGFMFPVTDDLAGIVMLMKGQKFYTSNFQFLFNS